MMQVYAPNSPLIFDEWFADNPAASSTTDIELALNQPIKIACVSPYYEMDYSPFDLVLISDIEFNHIRPIKEWLANKNIVRYLIALGGLEGYTATGDFIYRPWWMFNLINKNTYRKSQQVPLFDFDILLGSQKPHRDFVMAKMQSTALINNSIINYRDVFSTPKFEDRTLTDHNMDILAGTRLAYPYISPNLNPEWEVKDTISYNVSDIVPWKIYDHTKYSVIAETVYERVFFLTEKTTKALFAKRIFVIFSCQDFLQQLRSLGFKTFNSIIDESYDRESNTIKRFEMAFKQVEFLAQSSYNSLSDQIQPILEHNHNRLFEYQQEIKTQMKNMVYNKLKEITC